MRLFQISEPEQKKATDSEAQELIVGIDLGTTNSLLAYFDGENFQFIQEHGSKLIPSVISVNNESKISVGKNADISEKSSVVRSIKRLMGKSPQESTSDYETIKEGSSTIKLKIQNLTLTPQEISARILKHLKELAETQFGKHIRKAIITVPAYFDENSRQATKDAATIAGLDVLRLLSEPTAAAICYGLDLKDEGLYLVYDLGGGTFDITLLKMQMGVFQVLATGGDNILGGDDFDNFLLEYLVKKYTLTVGNRTNALYETRKLKEYLSYNDSYEGEFLGAKVTISKADFLELVKPIVERTLNLVEKVISDSKVNRAQIRQIILVGGATKMPVISELLKGRFGYEILDFIDPEEVVAKGAALQAYNLSSGAQTLLLDVIPISLAIEVGEGGTEKFILRNSTIPISHSISFTTQVDGQTGFVLHVLQGESEQANKCRSLARVELKGLPAMPKGALRLKITFSVDADGLLRVEAYEEISGKSLEVQVKPSYGLTDDQIKELLIG